MKSSRANEPKANAMNEKHSRNPRKLLAKLGRNAVTFLLTASMVIWQTPAAAFAAPNGDDGSPQPAPALIVPDTADDAVVNGGGAETQDGGGFEAGEQAQEGAPEEAGEQAEENAEAVEAEAAPQEKEETAPKGKTELEAVKASLPMPVMV